MAGNPANQVPPKGPTVFNCPNCGAGVEVRALGLSISVACKACGSIIDVNDENHKILSQFQINHRIQPLLPLGQRGKLGKARWEVIGFMVRSDASNLYPWREYLLFNPTQGFRWLTEFNGHWNFIATVKKNSHVVLKKDRSDRGYADYMNRKYYLFNKGSALVRYVLGEFYWRVKVGDSAEVADYICPPEMLSKEETPEEVIWSVGEYIEPEIIRSAFKIKETMPTPKGVGANQLSSMSQKISDISGLWMTFAVIMLFIQILTLFNSKNEKVFAREYLYRLNSKEVSPPFELRYGSANVEVELFSPVKNNWMEVGVELVNDYTGQAYGFEQGVEYYYGSDSDGSWSEGSQTSKFLLARIPSGTYHLNITPAKGSEGKVSNLSYQVTVARDVAVWGNFVAAMIIWTFPLALFLIGKYSFELTRWSDSDFSPYVSGDSDD